MNERTKVYTIYLLSALPTMILSWKLGFPRGYFCSFLGVSIGCLILNHYNDELIKERKIWKEYFIGLIGLIFVPVVGYLHGSGLYMTLNDLYYLLIGITVFQIGLVPIYALFDFKEDFRSWKSASAWLLGTSSMMILSYILFIIMDIRVVH